MWHKRVPTLLRFAAATIACVSCAPTAAQAGAGLSVTPTFPTSSQVGQTGLPASVTIVNANTGTDVSATICNFGDRMPCPPFGEGITLTSSCGGQGADSACVVADPGVFAMSTLAHGAAGSACADMTFIVTPAVGPLGTVRFDPLDMLHVVLPAPGSSCRIDFTVSVVKLPSTDAQPGIVGMQTIPIAGATMRSNNGTTSFARGSDSGVTVPAPAPPPPPNPPPPPLPPPPPPPAGPPTPPPAPQPTPAAPTRGQATKVVGTAFIVAGRRGCQARPFRVQVAGTAIAKVVFRLDARKVKTLAKPNRGSRYSLLVVPKRLRFGAHRVTATATFAKSAGRKAQVMRNSFRRCRLTG